MRLLICTASIRSALAAAILLSMPSSGVIAAERDPSSWKWNDPKELNIPGLHHATIESPSMKRTVGYCIYLPPQYAADSTRRFPVVFFLHGAGGTESSDAGLARNVHGEVSSGRIAPVIYVFPNGGQTSGYRDWKEEQANVRTETMLIRELLPHLDATYRTMTNAAARGICGFSMGGGGAVRLSLKYPEIFGSAASLAAALEESAGAQDGDNCYRHATALGAEARAGLRLYFVIGEDDFLYRRHAPFLKHCKELGIATTLVTHSGVGHNLGKLNELSADAMIRHLARQMRQPIRSDK